MDLKQEYEKIEEHVKVEWFKAKAGKYQIVIIGEPEEDNYTDETSGKITEQAVLDIEINKAKYKWSISKGITFASLFGQIMALAKNNDYKTNGLSITLLVKNDGFKNDYTILEAMDLKETK